MLIEFRVKNYKSIRDEQVLSMVASTKDKSLPNNTFQANDLTLLKTAAIFGPNASGKSNIISAMESFQYIVRTSANVKPGDEIPLIPFLLDMEFIEQPSSFEISFILNEVRYQYGLSATRQKIVKEKLVAFPKNRPQLWFKRSYIEELSEYEWQLGSSLKGKLKDLRDRTGEKALFLSVGGNWNHPQLKPIWEWLQIGLRVVSTDPQLAGVTAGLIEKEKIKNQSPEGFRTQTLEFLKAADLGIHDISIQFLDKNKNPKNDREKASIQEVTPLASIKEPEYIVKVEHRIIDTDETLQFPLEIESLGTIRLFRLAGPWIETVKNGYTVFFDELGSSLHPHLLKRLVDFIQSNSVPGKEAQLIFTTHDATLFDQSILRRDQIWLTEKSAEGTTSLYPLSDYRPRNEEAIGKGYLSGRYGAIPILESVNTFFRETNDKGEEETRTHSKK